MIGENEYSIELVISEKKKGKGEVGTHSCRAYG
jgi:hypothetical protein